MKFVCNFFLLSVRNEGVTSQERRDRKQNPPSGRHVNPSLPIDDRIEFEPNFNLPNYR